MFNQNKDFEDHLDAIDAHCFTGDVLSDKAMRELLQEYLTRWQRRIDDWQDISNEVMSLNENE